MNVVIAMPWDQHMGGVTHVAASLGRSLQQRGHDVTFVFPSETGLLVHQGTSKRGFRAWFCRLRDFPPDGASIRARISWYSVLGITLPQLIARTLFKRIDLINVHYPSAMFVLLNNLAHWLRVPLVVSAHGADLLADAGPIRTRGLLHQLEHADAVVVPSQHFLKSVVEAYPSLAPKLRCIHNGYDEQELAELEGWPAGDVSHAPAPGAPVNALCIAALIPKKGIDVLLRALQLCQSSQVNVRIVGEGPLRDSLEALRDSLGLQNRVQFVGEKDRKDVFVELTRCDMLIMPSRHASESFGLATLEAMVCAKPVVASAVGGLQELVADGETGLLVPADDPAALAGALDRMAADGAMRIRFGIAGRARARRFKTQISGAEYEALFTDLIARAGRGKPAPAA